MVDCTKNYIISCYKSNYLSCIWKRITRFLIQVLIVCSIFIATGVSVALAGPPAPNTLPQGPTVKFGNVNFNKNGNHLRVNQKTNNAIVNWNSFSIGSGASFHFQQPGAQSIILNRVTGGSISQIYGVMTSTGRVWIVNPAGIWFGPSARVDVAGLLATTANISDDAFKNGLMTGHFSFGGAPAGSTIINEGVITVRNAGLAAFVAPNVVNNGRIEAHMGTIVLGGSDHFTVDFNGDQLISFTVGKGTQNKSRVDNNGTITANGGKVIMSASGASGVLDNVINMKGVVETKSVSVDKNGEIVLGAGDVHVSGKLIASGRDKKEKGGHVTITGKHIEVDDNAVIDTTGDTDGGVIFIGGSKHGNGPLPNADVTKVHRGAMVLADATTNGNGGTIIVWGNDAYANGNFSAKGGSESGNGGLIETSGHHLETTGININLSAASGKTGDWLLDPYNVTISTSADTANYFSGGDPDTYTPQQNSNINTTTLATNLHNANVIITTNPADVAANPGNIVVQDAVTWDSANTLTLEAAGAIKINAPITATLGTLKLIASDTPASITTSDQGSITVANFNLVGGRWHQVVGDNGLFILPSFTVSGNFSINNGSMPSNVAFLRAVGGDGSASKPYQLTDIYGLQGIGSTTTTLGYNYILSSTSTSIDASPTINWSNPGGGGFIPIAGAYSQTFDGNNVPITNLYIYRPSSSLVALFSNPTGTLKNVILTNVSITGKSLTAALAGISSGYIINSSSSGSITATGDNVGGLVGESVTSISNSHSSATVTASGLVIYTGGLVGTNYGDVTTSYSTGNVTGYYEVGGLVGFSNGTISNSYSMANVNGNNIVGGFIGDEGFGGSITSSFSTGSVSANSNVGGFAGVNKGNGTIKDSYSTGAVTASTSTSIGGFTGYNDGKILNSYSIGKVTGNGGNVGGFIGFNGFFATASNDFWDTTTSNQSSGIGLNNGPPATVTPGTFSTLSRASTYPASWDMGSSITTDTWGIKEGASYPYLHAFSIQVSGSLPSSNAFVVKLVNNGTLIDSDTFSSNYTFLIPNNVNPIQVGDDFLVYVNGPAVGNAVTEYNGTNIITGLNVLSNTVTLGSDVTITSLSNTDLKTAAGALSGSDPLVIYSVDNSNNLTLGNGTYTSVDLKSSPNIETYKVNGNIAPIAGGSNNLDFEGPVAATSATTTLTATGNIQFLSSLTWSTSNTLNLVAGQNLFFNDAVYGGTFDLSASTSTAKSIQTGDNGSIKVNDFLLTAGNWYQVVGDGITMTLPDFTVNNNFSINNGNMPTSAPATVEFIRAGGGDGTLTPYELEDIYGVQGIASTTNTLGKKYKLTKDIDATVTQNWTQSTTKGFVPIGLGNSFPGTFDGDNYVINNLYIYRPTSTNVGLFGTATGEIKNIGLTNINITGQSAVGGLAGQGTIITNAYTSGTLVGNHFIGGLVGANFGTISDSHSNTNINLTFGASGAGGLVGTNGSIIFNSYSKGTLTSVGASNNLGGLVGQTSPSSQINNSYSEVNLDVGGTNNNSIGGLVGINGHIVNNSYSTGSITSADNSNFIGGLVGFNFENASIHSTVTNSFSTSALTVNGSNNTYVGGLVGINLGSIQQSYSLGPVSANSTTYVGGLVGYNNASILNAYTYSSVTATTSASIGGFAGANVGSISNSYSIGVVLGGPGNLGGFIGSNSGGTLTNNFWDMKTSGITDATKGCGDITSCAGLTGGTFDGSSGVNLSKSSTFTNAGWDFTTVTGVWGNIEDKSYPFLQAFYNPATTSAISGTVSGVPAKTIVEYLNGPNLDSTETYANNFYYFLEGNNLVSGQDSSISSPSGVLVILPTSSVVGNAVTSINAYGSTKGLNISPNTLSIGSDDTATVSNLTLLQATCNSCSDPTILYAWTGSGNNILIGNSTYNNINFITTTNATYDANGTIAPDTNVGDMTFMGPAIIEANVTSGKDLIFNNTVNFPTSGVVLNSQNLKFTSPPTGNIFTTIGNGNSTLTLPNANSSAKLQSSANGFNGLISVAGGTSFYFENYKTFIGQTGKANLLTGENVSSTWNVNSVNSGTYNDGSNTFNFTDFPSLTGGTNNDIFMIASGASLSGIITGGSGINTLSYLNNINGVTVNINGTYSGSATAAGSSFVAIQKIVGGSSNDEFKIGPLGYIYNLDGGPGSNTLTYNQNYPSAVAINLQSNIATAVGNGITNIQNFFNENSVSGSLFVGPNAINTWTINSTNVDPFQLNTLSGGSILYSFSGFQNLTGGPNTDTFKFANNGYVSGNIAGSGGSNTLDYQNYSSPIVANITGVYLGNSTGIGGSFSGIQNVKGGSGTDQFNISAPGYLYTLDGGLGSGNTIKYISYPNIVAINLQFNLATAVGGGFANIQNFIGNDVAGSYIVAPNTTNTWTLNASSLASTDRNEINTGSATYHFIGFKNLTGGANDDTFVFSNNVTLGGTIAGGGSSNTLNYQNYLTPITANITDIYIGNGTSGNFNGIQHIIGGSADDQFNIGPSGQIYSLHGNAGVNTLSYSASYPDTIAINLSTRRATAVNGNINQLQSFAAANNDANNYIIAANVVNNWVVNGTNTVTLNGAAISGFGNITGGTDTDYFTFANGATLSGVLNGGNNNGSGNTLDLSQYSTPYTIKINSDTPKGKTGIFINSNPNPITGGFRMINTIIPNP